MQVQLLAATLKLSLQVSLLDGSATDSLDEDGLRQHLQLDSACLRATVYCRAPASLQSGDLQLQLVAMSEDGGGNSRAAAAQAAQRFLFLGQGESASMAEQERWIVEQPVIVLPDRWGWAGGAREGMHRLAAGTELRLARVRTMRAAAPAPPH